MGGSFAMELVAGFVWNTQSDNQAADQLQKARQKLFRTIHEQSLRTG
jgi:hypothetical protein